jgi:dTDP-4-dehydrorhamnose 3,5-epimerase-like enzyme
MKKNRQLQQLTAGKLDAVRWVELPSHRDERGVLTAIESGVHIPFEVKRVYFLHHIAAERGGHAHRDTHQVVVALSGHCELVLSDGRESRSFQLDNPTCGLLLVPMLFIRIQHFSPDAAIVVLASTHYDKTRSIRSWEDYLLHVGKSP